MQGVLEKESGEQRAGIRTEDRVLRIEFFKTMRFY